MPRKLSTQEQERFLAGRHVAVLVTLAPGGEPVPTPIWYLYRDGRFYFRTGAEAIKTRNARRDPRVSICIQDERPPYRAIVVRGTAEVSEGSLGLAEEMPQRYLGFLGALGYRRGVRQQVEQGEEVTIIVTPTKITSLDYTPETPLVGRLWFLLKRFLPPWL